MIPKSDEYRTGNYALTTVLRTLGFPWEFPDQPCANAYTDGASPKRDKRGRLEKLGKVTFMLRRKSSEYPDTPISAAIEAYDGDGETYGRKLDELLDPEMGEHNDDPGEVVELKAELRALMPLVYAECARNALANLRAVRDAPHNCQAHTVVKKPNGMPIVVPENASDELLERWNLKRREASA